jgi:serine/threonine protein kinase
LIVPDTPEAEPEDPLIGKGISHYTIVAPIGRGGMGLVYRARHDTLGRDGAIKFLPEQFAVDPEYVERFLREARAAAVLSHPNIISVYDAGEENGIYYLVMEYVDGRNLRQLLQEQPFFPEADVIRFGIKAAEGLAYAHQKGIIHRDIKPENLMFTGDGELKIADLGLAKQTREEGSSATMSGAVMGTPFYISPEQIRGSKDVDLRTDIYSLGVTLFHLATGRIPFEGGSPAEIMSKHLTETPPLARDVNDAVSDGLSQLLAKMMSKDLSRRYQTMAEVRADLEGLLKGKAPSLDSAETIIAAPRKKEAVIKGVVGLPAKKPSQMLPPGPSDTDRMERPPVPEEMDLPLMETPSAGVIPPPEPAPEPQPPPSLPRESQKLKLRTPLEPVGEHRSQASRSSSKIVAAILKVAVPIALLAALVILFPKIKEMLIKPLPPVPMEKVIREKVDAVLSKEGGEIPKDFPSAAKARFSMTLNAPGDIASLTVAPEDPEPLATLVEITEQAIHKAAPFARPIPQGGAPLSSEWKGLVSIEAKIAQMPTARPFNATEEGIATNLKNAMATVQKQIGDVEAEIKRIREAMSKAPSSGQQAPPSPPSPGRPPSGGPPPPPPGGGPPPGGPPPPGGGASSGRLIGEFKGDMTRRFEGTGPDQRGDANQQLARMNEKIEELRLQGQKLEKQFAPYKTGNIIEPVTRLVFMVEVAPAGAEPPPVAK